MAHIGLTYEGKVEIRLEKNGKVMRSIFTHNEGTTELFNFLCNCCAGNFSVINAPSKVMLYNNSEISQVISSNLGTSLLQSAVKYSSIDVGDSGNQSYVTYKFVIPFNLISSGSSSVNVLGLYSDKQANSSTTSHSMFPSAYIILDSSTQDLTPIDLSNLNSSYNIIILWTITIKNIV